MEILNYINDFFETAFLFCDFHDQFDCRVPVNYQIKNNFFSHTTTENRREEFRLLRNQPNCILTAHIKLGIIRKNSFKMP